MALVPEPDFKIPPPPRRVTNETGAMELRLKTTDGEYDLWLDDKRLHHIESYKIERAESAPYGPYAELSIKMLVHYPVVKELDASAGVGGLGRGEEMAKKYYRCAPSMADPNVKCPVRESEIRLDLEERIRETEDNIELAALVGAWRQVTKDRAIEGVIQYEPLEARTGTAIKEIMVNFLIFVLGAITAIAFLILLN